MTGPESLMITYKHDAPQSSYFHFEDFMLTKDPWEILQRSKVTSVVESADTKRQPTILQPVL